MAFRRDLPPDGNPEIFVIDLSSGAETQLTDHDGYDSDPQFSPDGATLLFSREIVPDNVEIASMSPTKGDTAVNFLTDQPGADQDPRWTPNGDAIIWTSHRDAGDAEIYWMRADGTHPQRLTDRAGEDGVADVRAL